MNDGCSYTYQPLSIARYSLIELNELEQCSMKNLAQGFNTAAQDLHSKNRLHRHMDSFGIQKIDE